MIFQNEIHSYLQFVRYSVKTPSKADEFLTALNVGDSNRRWQIKMTEEIRGRHSVRSIFAKFRKLSFGGSRVEATRWKSRQTDRRTYICIWAQTRYRISVLLKSTFWGEDSIGLIEFNHQNFNAFSLHLVHMQRFFTIHLWKYANMRHWQRFMSNHIGYMSNQNILTQIRGG